MSENQVEISFSGFGGELQYHRLNKEEAESLHSTYEDDPESFLCDHLTGGEDFHKSIWRGSYGANIHDLEVKVWCDGESHDLDLSDVQKECIAKISDEDAEEKSCVDYIYLTEGKVFGTATIDLANGEKFDPSKLKITYIDFCLDGLPEKSGAIVTGFIYHDEECEVETEDNGVDVFRYLIGYEYDEDEFCDVVVLYDSAEGDEEFNWDELSRIF